MSLQNIIIKNKYLALATFLTSTVGIASCSSATDYKQQDLSLPKSYKTDTINTKRDTTPQQVSALWWREFHDPVLTKLIESSLLHNTDILRAIARVEQAHALSEAITSAEVPNVDLKTSGTRSKSSEQTNGSKRNSTFNASLSSAFEIDLWGKLHKESELARAQTLASSYANEVVRQTIASQIAQSYFSLITIDLQIEITSKNIQNYLEGYNIQQLRLKQGLVGQLELRQAEIMRIEANIQLSELKRQQAILISKLSVLAADPDLSLGDRPKSLPDLPEYPAIGIPSELLERRPDVRQAEQQLKAATSKINVAEAARLPSFSLTTSAGGESATLKNLLSNPSEVWSFSPSIDLPIFDSGRRKAVVEQAIAERKAAAADYESTVYVAFQDVSDALTNLQAAGSAQADAESKLEAAIATLDMSDARYNAGYSGFLEVLETERTVNSSQFQLVNNRQAQIIAMIDLFKSLGGGWSVKDQN